MVEYLNWLNNMIKSENRKVLLLMDNFSAHESAVKELGGETALSNVEIEWLPPNITSYWQPLNQGIIASFKLQASVSQNVDRIYDQAIRQGKGFSQDGNSARGY